MKCKNKEKKEVRRAAMNKAISSPVACGDVYFNKNKELRPYSWKCYANFKLNPRARGIGLEIETDYVPENYNERSIYNIYNIPLVFKSDSTVADAELVTHIMDYSSLKLCRKGWEFLADMECKDGGYHVHIGLPEEQMYRARSGSGRWYSNNKRKVIQFCKSFMWHNRAWAYVLSERPSREAMNRFAKIMRNNNSARYQAVNVTSTTIEFRLFNSTNDGQRIFAISEFCYALTVYAMQVSRMQVINKGPKKSRKLFAEWLTANHFHAASKLMRDTETKYTQGIADMRRERKLERAQAMNSNINLGGNSNEIRI